jgi:hypothetical protein
MCVSLLYPPLHGQAIVRNKKNAKGKMGQITRPREFKPRSADHGRWTSPLDTARSTALLMVLHKADVTVHYDHKERLWDGPESGYSPWIVRP